MQVVEHAFKLGMDLLDLLLVLTLEVGNALRRLGRQILSLTLQLLLGCRYLRFQLRSLLLVGRPLFLDEFLNVFLAFVQEGFFEIFSELLGIGAFKVLRETL